jgi:signal peptidase I
MNFNLFGSGAVRQAKEMLKQVRKHFNAQRDILSPQAVAAIETAMQNTRKAIADRVGDEALRKQSADLETAANKWLKPYPNASIRENVEVLLVALSVAVGIRTFIVQPFKIPTGSMQPTLFGVTPSRYTPGAHNQPDLKIPGPVARFFDYWIHGVSYYNEVAPQDGTLLSVGPVQKFLLFNLKQDYVFNGQSHTIWFPADDLFGRAGYRVNPNGGPVFESALIKAGEPIVRLKTLAGDHLFVDRMSYNFRHPKRGEIIVFETKGIERMSLDQQGEFYIKRMVALGDEKVQIGNDRHLVINGQRLDEHTPHFANVYSFDPNEPPRESHYSGHVNQTVASKYNPLLDIAPLFPDEATVQQVRPNHYMVMGDNTMNSSDSRTWGDFTRTNVIGKYFFVYWPISPRFGCSVQ